MMLGSQLLPQAPHCLFLDASSPCPLWGPLLVFRALFPFQAEHANTSLLVVLSSSAPGEWEKWVYCQLPWCKGLSLGPGQMDSCGEFFPWYLVEWIAWVVTVHKKHLMSF